MSMCIYGIKYFATAQPTDYLTGGLKLYSVKLSTDIPAFFECECEYIRHIRQALTNK